MKRNEKAKGNEFGKTISRLAQMGCNPSWVARNTNPGKTRGENADSLKAAMKGLPKG